MSPPSSPVQKVANVWTQDWKGIVSRGFSAKKDEPTRRVALRKGLSVLSSTAASPMRLMPAEGASFSAACFPG